LEEWTTAAEFEAVVARAIKDKKVLIQDGVPSMASWSPLTDMAVHTSPSVPPGMMYVDKTTNQIFVGTDTASQIRFASGTTPEKQEKPMSERNNKTFEVVYEDDSSELIPAQTANEVEGRLTFTGFVEGVDESYGNTVIKSVRASDVKSYRVVPKPEVDQKVVGKNTYRVNLTDGTAKDVKADQVLFQGGSNDRPGRYSLVTGVRGSDSRSEYIVPEDKVSSVERVENDGASTTLPTPADAASGTSDNV
jgi:hypothetical protein